MKKATMKSWSAVHKWSSLVCTVFILMLCITGLPLIFSHEIDHALGYAVEAPSIEHDGERASPDRIISDAAERQPGNAVQFLVGDPDEPNLWFVRLGEEVNAADPSGFFTYDARSGEFLSEYPVETGITSILLSLHIDMFAGLPGMLFLGFMGFLLLVSLVSGAYLYGPFMRNLRFGEVRRERPGRIKWLDLHNALGIVTLVWFFVVTATGVINTLVFPIFEQWQTTELAELTEPYRDLPPVKDPVSVDRVLASAREVAPDMALSFMAFPGNDFATPHHFIAYMQGTTPLTSSLLEFVLIEADTGKAVTRSELPWYVETLLVSQPLHFGDYGGMPLKLVWALLDILTIVVLGSGLYLWLKRGRAGAQTEPARTDAALPQTRGYNA
ncbi:MAG: PepSY-associated TM helix domain-containing protein [Thiohalophilus sp.]